MEVMIRFRPLPLELWEENSQYPPRRNLVGPRAGLAGTWRKYIFFLFYENRNL